MDLTIDRTLLYDYFQCFFHQLSLPVVLQYCFYF
jgi:hypothetical protein